MAGVLAHHANAADQAVIEIAPQALLYAARVSLESRSSCRATSGVDLEQNQRSEVSDQLDKDLKKHLSLVAAKQEATQYLQELKGGAGWLEQAQKKGLKTDETGFFRRGGTVPKIGYAPFLSEAAFSLSEQKRYPDDVFAAGNKVYVIRWLTEKALI